MSREIKLRMLLLLMLAVLVYFFSININNNKAQSSYKDKMIRLHVIANSDSEEDQELKLKVRDEIIHILNQELIACKAVEESKRIIQNNLKNIEDTAQRTLINNGYVYPVQAQLGMTWIPQKKYGKLTLPAGEYEALNIVIGEGKGQNWWCVLFPPLCLINNNEENTDMMESLSQYLTEEEFQLLIDETNGSGPVLQLKSLTLEKADELKADIKKIITKISKTTASVY